MVTEVLVEYLRGSAGYYDENENWHWKILGLKVNPKDNTITIKKVKDNFTREETVRIALKMQYDYSEYKKSCKEDPDMREIADWTNTWLEENL